MLAHARALGHFRPAGGGSGRTAGSAQNLVVQCSDTKVLTCTAGFAGTNRAFWGLPRIRSSMATPELSVEVKLKKPTRHLGEGRFAVWVTAGGMGGGLRSRAYLAVMRGQPGRGITLCLPFCAPAYSQPCELRLRCRLNEGQFCQKIAATWLK